MATPDGATRQPGVFTEPYRAYQFLLNIEGESDIYFTECRGLGAKIQTIKYREGGTNQIVHTLPGQVEYGEVTLLYGLTNSRGLWDWFMSALQGRVTRKHVSIIMLDKSGSQEVMRWSLIDAWPAQWRGATLDALNGEIAIESLVLVYDSLERE